MSCEDVEPVPSLCPALGSKMHVGTRSNIENSYSIDRTVPEVGYVSGNVDVISNRANRIKSNALPDEILAVAVYSFSKHGHSVSDIHAAVDAILAKQAEYRRINEEARSLEVPAQEKAS